MGQQSKYTFEMKLSVVTKYLEGNTSLESLARSLGTNGARIVEWVTLYPSLGAEGLRTASKLSTYSTETKRNDGTRAAAFLLVVLCVLHSGKLTFTTHPTPCILRTNEV